MENSHDCVMIPEMAKPLIVVIFTPLNEKSELCNLRLGAQSGRKVSYNSRFKTRDLERKIIVVILNTTFKLTTILGSMLS